MQLNYEKCKTCRYFVQHYNIDCDYIYKVQCGHCVKNLSERGFKGYSGKQPCPHYEANKGQRNKMKKKRLIDFIENIDFNIACIKLFLNKNAKKQLVDECVKDFLNEKTK